DERPPRLPTGAGDVHRPLGRPEDALDPPAGPQAHAAHLRTGLLVPPRDRPAPRRFSPPPPRVLRGGRRTPARAHRQVLPELGRLMATRAVWRPPWYAWGLLGIAVLLLLYKYQ